MTELNKKFTLLAALSEFALVASGIDTQNLLTDEEQEKLARIAFNTRRVEEEADATLALLIQETAREVIALGIPQTENAKEESSAQRPD